MVSEICEITAGGSHCFDEGTLWTQGDVICPLDFWPKAIKTKILIKSLLFHVIPIFLSSRSMYLYKNKLYMGHCVISRQKCQPQQTIKNC